MSDFEKDPNDLFGGDESQQPNEESKPENTGYPNPNREESFDSENHGGYGYSYPEEYSHPRNGKPKKQKNGTSSLLIAFCLILFIFIGISVGAIFDVGRDIGDPNQTINGPASSSSTSTISNG